MAIPKDYAPFFWGWPTLLVSRMEQANTDIILVDRDFGHINGIDDPKEFQVLARSYKGMVWTDKIELLG